MAVNIQGKPLPPSAVIKQQKYASHLNDLPAKQAVATVDLKKTVSKQTVYEDQSQEVVHPGMVGECSVTVSGGRTIATAPYENVKIGVTLTLPCKFSDIEATYEFATDWVGNKLLDAVKSTGA